MQMLLSFYMIGGSKCNEKMAVDSKILVAIHCFVYNHEPYLRDCFEGFVMQKTNFRFVAIVHDDCSTDGSANIIREYTQKYPDIFRPIYETENQYSKHDGSLDRIMMDAIAETGAKYIAFCEGDDYWIDPMKLQKQVEFMEDNEKVSMCTHAHITINDKKEVVAYSHTRSCNGMLDNGLIIEHIEIPQTATMLIRSSCLKNYPDFFKHLSVGDYPLRVYAAITGGVYYHDYLMSCYRTFSANSWTKRMVHNKKNFIIHLDKTIKFSEELDKYTSGIYHNNITRRIDFCLCLKYIITKHILKAIKTDYFKHLSSKNKITLLLRYRFPDLWFVLTTIYGTFLHWRQTISKSENLLT